MPSSKSKQGQSRPRHVVGSLPRSAPVMVTAQGVWVQDLNLACNSKRDADQHAAHHGRRNREIFGSGWSRGSARFMPRSWSANLATAFRCYEQRSADLETWTESDPSAGKKSRPPGRNKVIRKIMVFLHSHGVSTSRSSHLQNIRRRSCGDSAANRIRSQGHPRYWLQNRRPDRQKVGVRMTRSCEPAPA